jgi:hypothetical protein
LYINLGSADHLPRQATFGVFSADSEHPSVVRKKGSVAVVSLKGPKLAEARITQENPTDPIGVGDLIYTPAWQPGRPEHLAIAGLVDIDGDGDGDLDQLLKLIKLSGGVVDAIVDEKGVSPQGLEPSQMTVETKFLILGDQPALGNGGDASAEGVTGYSGILNQARALTIRRISLDDFLDHIGYVRQDGKLEFGNETSSSRPSPARPNYQRFGT